MLKDMFTLLGRWGRLNRLRYFGYGALANIVFMVIVFAFVAISFGGALDFAALGGLLLLVIPLYLVLFWVAICLMLKRLHDLDKSGWWILFLFVFSFLSGFVAGVGDTMEMVSLLLQIPVFGFALWLLFWPGTAGDNQYGPNPLDQA
jgi:uncharacterized membrane protein YhaH (DUF805 family)